MVSSLVIYFNLTGYLSFTNLPGIILSNSSLLAVLASPTDIFPRLFKVGHTMLTFDFVPVGILDRKLGGGTDIAHNLGAMWISGSMFILKWSLDKEAKDSGVAST